MTSNDELQALIDTYEVHSTEWEACGDSLVAFASTAGWIGDWAATVKDFRHQAETCRYPAQEVRDSMN